MTPMNSYVPFGQAKQIYQLAKISELLALMWAGRLLGNDFSGSDNFETYRQETKR
jgi:hypothetical protein